MSADMCMYVCVCDQSLSVHRCLIYYLCLRFNGHVSRCTWVSQYQNVSVLDFIGANEDGRVGNNWV